MPKIIYQYLSNDEVLAPVRDYYRKHRELPSFKVWRENQYKPSTKVLIARFGSWSNVLKLARQLPEQRVEPYIPVIPENQVYRDKVKKKPYELPVCITRMQNYGIAIN